MYLPVEQSGYAGLSKTRAEEKLHFSRQSPVLYQLHGQLIQGYQEQPAALASAEQELSMITNNFKFKFSYQTKKYTKLLQKDLCPFSMPDYLETTVI